jgi:hypothetical protein
MHSGPWPSDDTLLYPGTQRLDRRCVALSIVWPPANGRKLGLSATLTSGKRRAALHQPSQLSQLLRE